MRHWTLALVLVLPSAVLAQANPGVIVYELEREVNRFRCVQGMRDLRTDIGLTFALEDDGLRIHISAYAFPLDLGMFTMPATTEEVDVEVIFFWPNTSETRVLDGVGVSGEVSDGSYQHSFILMPGPGLLYELANSGSDVPLRINGARGGTFEALLPQAGLNGLQAFTMHCLE